MLSCVFGNMGHLPWRRLQVFLQPHFFLKISIQLSDALSILIVVCSCLLFLPFKDGTPLVMDATILGIVHVISCGLIQLSNTTTTFKKWGSFAITANLFQLYVMKHFTTDNVTYGDVISNGWGLVLNTMIGFACGLVFVIVPYTATSSRKLRMDMERALLDTGRLCAFLVFLTFERENTLSFHRYYALIRDLRISIIDNVRDWEDHLFFIRWERVVMEFLFRTPILKLLKKHNYLHEKRKSHGLSCCEMMLYALILPPVFICTSFAIIRDTSIPPCFACVRRSEELINNVLVAGATMADAMDNRFPETLQYRNVQKERVKVTSVTFAVGQSVI